MNTQSIYTEIDSIKLELTAVADEQFNRVLSDLDAEEIRSSLEVSLERLYMQLFAIGAQPGE